MTESDLRIREAISRRVDNEAELARQIGVTRSHINQIMTGRRGLIPKSLLAVVEAAGLELIAVPKDTARGDGKE